MEQFNLMIGAFGFKGIVFLVLGIFVVVFLLKKLFKLAILIALIAFLIHYGLPIIQSVTTGIH